MTASGTYSVKARAIHSGGTLKAETSATVTIMLQAAQSPDPAPPTVQLTSPLAEAIVVAPTGSISLEVKGTAVDEGANASGVDFVEVAVDGGTPVKATPKASGNWSEWKASIPVSGERAHQITARAVDKGGLSSTVGIRIQLVKQPIVEPLLARLVLVESYRLSTFAGNYGAGKTLRTFSLLAGEETTISIKSYQRTEATSKQASSILDSYTTESATEFAQAVEREQSYKENYQDSFNYNVNGGTNASWGWGSASIDAGVSGGTNAAREEFAKNVINATQKHAAKASAKRDVQINTSFEVKQESGEETSIERKIENLNVSRTLNYVFRQLNQQFISILHLIDARIAYVRVDLVNGQRRTTYREVTLPQLDSLLADVIREPYRQRVRNAIAYQLQFVFDYKDFPWAFVEEKDLSGADGKPVPNTKFLRVRRDLFPTYKDENGNQYTVPGVILGATSTVLRTDSLIVDAILGRGEALDNYSQTLRNEASKSETLANGVTQSDIDRAALAVDLVKTKNADGAKIFEQVYGLGGSAAQAPPKAIAEELTTDGHHD